MSSRILNISQSCMAFFICFSDRPRNYEGRGPRVGEGSCPPTGLNIRCSAVHFGTLWASRTCWYHQESSDMAFSACTFPTQSCGSWTLEVMLLASLELCKVNWSVEMGSWCFYMACKITVVQHAGCHVIF